MDRDDLGAVKRIGFAGLAFLLSAYASWKEVKFMMWGATATAEVVSVQEETGGRRRRSYLAVEYRFTEADGTSRSEKDDVPTSYEVTAPGTVNVQYLPGVADSSRLEGTANNTALFVFVGSIGWVAWTLYSFYREAHAPVGPRSRRG